MTRLFYLENNMKVLIATTSVSPEVTAFFSQSMAETYALGVKEDIEFKFYWSADPIMYRNEAVAAMEDGDFDSVFFIKPHIEWRALDLINIVKNDSLVEGVPTRHFYHPQRPYKAVLNTPKEDAPVTAKIMDLDFINIKKEVFTMIREQVLTINKEDEEGIIEQRPLYFYSISDSNGVKTEDLNFCEALEKVEIPIYVNTKMKIYEHIWSPNASDIGTDIKNSYISEKMKEFDSI